MAAVGATRREDWAMLVVALVVCALILAPILVVLGQSLVSHTPGGLSFRGIQNYAATFGQPWVRKAILVTLLASVGSTAFAIVVGVSLAWLNARTNMPMRGFFELANVAPFFLSPFVGAIAWMDLAAPRIGYINGVMHSVLGLPNDLLNVYGLGGIVWVQGIFFTPLVYLMTVGTLRRMDPALEESSRACGLSMWATTWRITLPLSMPAILSALVLVFVSSAGEFGVPLALGSPYGVNTLSTQIFEVLQRAEPRYDLAATMGFVLLATTVALVLVYRWIILRHQYITVSGKGYRSSPFNLGRWRYVGLGWNLFYLIVTVFFPLLILFIVSLQAVWLGSVDTHQFTLDNYRYILTDATTQAGIKHSLMLAISGATVAVALGLVISRVIYRSAVPGQRWIDIVTSIPVGVPGIVLSMGVLILFIRTPLYGTLTAMLMAYVARFIPVAQRSVGSSLLALSPELEESSRACGSGWLRTLYRILLPLLKPGLIAAWILLFVIFLRELPISILLWTSGTEVMSVALYQLLEHATAGQTAAYAIIQAAIVLGVLVVFRRLVRGESIIEA